VLRLLVDASIAAHAPDPVDWDLLLDITRANGVLVRTAAGVVEVPPVEVEVVNGLGAGDAFGGALVYGLLQGWAPDRAVRLANAAGAYVAARLACADDMPTLGALRDMVGEELLA